MAHHAATTKEALSIPGPAGILEALLEFPEGGPYRRIAVICHPHPLHQGSMLNKVVHTVSRAMMDLGVPALRFNFRGVGASDGKFAEGVGETDDALAACAWMRERYPGAQLLLAGFSFGAMVACNAAVAARPAHLIAIAPPAGRSSKLLAGRRPDGPWTIIQGDADGVVSTDEVTEWVAGLTPAPELIVLPGVDHFFHGNLTLLRQTIVRRLGAAA